MGEVISMDAFRERRGLPSQASRGTRTLEIVRVDEFADPMPAVEGVVPKALGMRMKSGLSRIVYKDGYSLYEMTLKIRDMLPDLA